MTIKRLLHTIFMWGLALANLIAIRQPDTHHPWFNWWAAAIMLTVWFILEALWAIEDFLQL